MENKHVKESLRKPRRTKGTPFYTQRNYYACGVLALGGVCWVLFELWPGARKLKRSQLEGKFDTAPEIKSRFLEADLMKKPGYMQLFSGLKARQVAREDAEFKDETKPQPWYSKIFYSQPDV